MTILAVSSETAFLVRAGSAQAGNAGYSNASASFA